MNTPTHCMPIRVKIAVAVLSSVIFAILCAVVAGCIHDPEFRAFILLLVGLSVLIGIIIHSIVTVQNWKDGR